MWKKRANPVYNQAETSFYKRDYELMSKRRYQKVIQAVNLEKEFGINITKMPEQLVQFSESPKKGAAWSRDCMIEYNSAYTTLDKNDS